MAAEEENVPGCDPFAATETIMDPSDIKQDLKFKRRLIAQVRKRPFLYDTFQTDFINGTAKEAAWLQISESLNTHVEVCKNTWVDLRCDYQSYVRRLRKFLASGYKNCRRRPIMALETDLIFLWRFVADKSRCSLPYKESTENTDTITITTPTPIVEDDDVVLLENDPVEVIDLDKEDEINPKTRVRPYREMFITQECRQLVDIVRAYTELYSVQSRYYQDYDRRGIIWTAIANELGDKATKLMKFWIQIQTRYEWEINFNKRSPKSDGTTVSELQKLLEFLKPHLDLNPNTIYKQSHYLRQCWQEPIEHFKNIFGLLAAMKKCPQIVNITEKLLDVEGKNDLYYTLWKNIAKNKGVSPGQCETTWLILRSFYWELMNMRKHNYQLQDKWYFESIITELYMLAAADSSASVVPAKTVTPPVENGTTIQLDEDAIHCAKIPNNKRLATGSADMLHNIKIPKIAFAQSLSPQVVITSTNSHTATNYSNIDVSDLQISRVQQSVQLPTLQPAVKPSTLPPVQSQVPLGFAPSLQQQPKITVGQMPAPATVATSLPSPHRAVRVALPTSVTTALSKAINKAITLPQSPAPPAAVNNVVPPLVNVGSPLPMVAINDRIGLPTAVTTTLSTVNALAATNLVTALPPPAVRNVRPVPPTTLTIDLSTTDSVVASNDVGLPPLVRNERVSLCQAALQKPTIQNNIAAGLPPLIRNERVTLPTTPTLEMTTTQPTAQLIPAPKLKPAMPPIVRGAERVTVPPTLSSALPKSGTNFTIVPSAVNAPPMVTLNVDPKEVNKPPLMKISNALSLLNPNEIMIELVSTGFGSQLVVHGPALTGKHSMSMRKTARFIRTVMAIPQLHTKLFGDQHKTNIFWQQVSKKFDMATYIAKACWNFLSENFNHFPKIAPMQELMRPFSTDIPAWRESSDLFKEFNANAVKMGWLQYKDKLPLLMKNVAKYPCLYEDLVCHKDAKLPDCDTKHPQPAWRKIHEKVWSIRDKSTIWAAFKNVFWMYMSDLECGVDNKWNANWWRTLAEMQFLVRVRYHDMQPMFYIVHNKIMEEIERFKATESLGTANPNPSPDEIPATSILKTVVSTPVDDEVVVYEINENNEIKEIGPSVIHDQPEPQVMDTIEEELLNVTSLILAMRRHAGTYQQNATNRAEEWALVAQELNTTVANCQVTFARALHDYQLYLAHDPTCQCHINEKFYKDLCDVCHKAKTQVKLTIKTPSELNNAIGKESNICKPIIPENFIADINMDSCSPALAMKNWAFAVGNFTLLVQECMEDKLRYIFDKYRPLSGE